MPSLGSYNPYGLQGGSYNPFDERSSWYGVPNYGANYNSYLQTQQQPLSLAQIVGMVREVQEGMNRNPVARLMSPVQQSEIPAQIAQNMMTDQHRLLSMPRRRMEESGSNALRQGGIEQDMNAPAATAPAATAPAASRTGSASGGGGGYSPTGAVGRAGALPTAPAGSSAPASSSPTSKLNQGGSGIIPRAKTLGGGFVSQYGGRTTATGRTAAGLRW